MDRQWKWRALGATALIIVSAMMLAPTLVSVGDDGGDAKTDGVVAEAEEQVLPEWYTNIFDQKLILGLDLQGGIHLQYKVDIEEALGRRAKQMAGNIETLMRKDREIEVKATPGAPGDIFTLTEIKVEFPDEASTGKLDMEFIDKHLPRDTMNRAAYEIGGIDGKIVSLVMTATAVDDFRSDALDKAMETIERRINEFGVAESTISKRGDSEVVVQLPGVKESEFGAAKKKLAQTGQLRFQIADRDAAPAFFTEIGKRQPKADAWPAELEGVDPANKVYVGNGLIRSTDRKLLDFMLAGQTDDDHLIGVQEIFVNPSDAQLNPIENLTEEQEKALNKGHPGLDAPIMKAYRAWYLFSKAGMSGENVEDASVGYDQFNRPVVLMRFSQVDADKFFEMTKQYTKELMAIMIDEIVYSAPRIKEPIPGGRVQIEMGVGNAAFKEAKDLVAVLKSGALQAPLRKLYDTQVGPTLGSDSVDAGRMSVMVGLAGVIIFMLVYYRSSGMVANMALLLNLLFVMAGLTAFGATLTLPGIAGIVLTVGMAVDANVLIFERIREELRAGQGVRKAIDLGYDKAFSAIFDANVTTAIAAMVLYQFGSGPIRGFAVTLGIGIISSMYTALVVTRLVFDFKYGRGTEPKQMSI
jgi:preprotein translocase subunit SecD